MAPRMISNLAPSERTKAWLALVVGPLCAFAVYGALAIWLAPQIEYSKMTWEAMGLLLLWTFCCICEYLSWRLSMAAPPFYMSMAPDHKKMAGAWHSLLMREEVVPDGHWRAQLPPSVVWLSGVSDASAAKDLSYSAISIINRTVV